MIPRALLIDLDGTIADTVPLFYTMSLDVFAAAGVAAPDEEAHRVALLEPGSPLERLFPADYPDRAKFFERIFAERFGAWRELYERDAAPLPGACEALRALRARGLPIALVTSSFGALPFLDRWGVRDAFATVVSREHVKNVKPHPEPLEMALAHLGIAANEVLHVGDSPLDVMAGVAAGVPTIGVLTGVGREPELRAAGAYDVIASLGALPDRLEEFRTRGTSVRTAVDSLLGTEPRIGR